MDILITIICASIVIGFIVFIHEGGHYLAARAFGVRVTEFMIGLPGPSIGFTKWGTKFGVTAIPLGGYAKVCGMETGEMSAHLQPVLAALYRRGTANMEDIALDCGITDDEAFEALEELVEWGSCVGPTKKDQFNTYRASATILLRKNSRIHIGDTGSKGLDVHSATYPSDSQHVYALGEARPVEDPKALFESEYSQQYRALPFWKRSVILLAGVAMNILFVMVAFVLIYSVLGLDIQNTETGEITHFNATVWQALQMGVSAVVMTAQAIIGLFNPATAAETVSNSTSIVGIAVMSKGYFEAGFTEALFFMALISISVGLMNLLPIPPLDGGRFVIEIWQKLTRRDVSARVINGLSMAGMALFLLFFAFMVNQDIQRFIFGNW